MNKTKFVFNQKCAIDLHLHLDGSVSLKSARELSKTEGVFLPSSDEELEIIKKRIIDDEVKYIAYEPNMTEDMLNLFNQLETELGLTRVNLNNVSSLTVSQSANNKDYLSLMYENLNVLENMATDIITVNNPTDIDQENTEIDNAE